jgi:hypothetical protein
MGFFKRQDGKLSKTVTVGLLEIVIAIASLVAGHEIIADYPQIISLLLLLVGILTIVLRKLTNQPLGRG